MRWCQLKTRRLMPSLGLTGSLSPSALTGATARACLGYYNPLTGTYEWTPFLRFLCARRRATDGKDGLAWFVILDEMNLAHVEYYFADLLSVLESGRDETGWTREPLRLIYPDEAEGDLPPHELRLPPNLYIVGTVNVDETDARLQPQSARPRLYARIDRGRFCQLSAGSRQRNR